MNLNAPMLKYVDFSNTNNPNRIKCFPILPKILEYLDCCNNYFEYGVPGVQSLPKTLKYIKLPDPPINYN